jgi:type VI secretion system protein ImpM
VPDDPMSRPHVGFFGKIPARGDFVRARLSRPLVAAWDDWMQMVLPAAMRLLGARWESAWQVAPVWRFALPAGQCGPSPLLGLWLPSIDAAGRRFPLMIAAEGALDSAVFLDAAEQIGRDAIACDLTPGIMLARLDATALARQDATALARPDATAPEERIAKGMAVAAQGHWWSEGGPLVRAGELRSASLPDAPAFAGMLHS